MLKRPQKLKKNLPLALTLLSKNSCFVKTGGRFFQILWTSHNVLALRQKIRIIQVQIKEKYSSLNQFGLPEKSWFSIMTNIQNNWKLLFHFQKSSLNQKLSIDKTYEFPLIAYPHIIITAASSSRVLSRFFDQVGRETMYASSGNKHFFTKWSHRQTYQNYEQPPGTSQNSYFQSHFSVSKIDWIFQKKISMKNIWLGDQLLLKNVFENFDFKDTLFSKIVPNFCRLCS